MREGLTYESLANFCQSRRTLEMPGPRPKYAITLTPEQEERLRQWSTCYMEPFAMQKGELTGLAILLTQQMKSPVVNTINIPSVWDFSFLDGADMGVSATAEPGVTGSIFAALEKLGLKLEPHKIPVQVFVIDNAEKPSVNGANQ